MSCSNPKATLEFQSSVAKMFLTRASAGYSNFVRKLKVVGWNSLGRENIYCNVRCNTHRTPLLMQHNHLLPFKPLMQGWVNYLMDPARRGLNAYSQSCISLSLLAWSSIPRCSVHTANVLAVCEKRHVVWVYKTGTMVFVEARQAEDLTSAAEELMDLLSGQQRAKLPSPHTSSMSFFTLTDRKVGVQPLTNASCSLTDKGTHWPNW